MIPAHEYRFALDQANKLADRRQAIRATYLSVNAALTGVIAFFFKDGRFTTLYRVFGVAILVAIILRFV